MIYEHPLAYLLGLEGVALLRAFTGEFDRQFVEARLAEVRELLDDESLNGQGVLVDRVDTVDGYRVWSTTYDEPRNGLFDFEEPLVREILDGRPAGVAVDAACGTGRYAEYLAAHGHQVIGVDSSPDMLARARTRVPQADFRPGDLQDLPLSDGSADIIVCGLALNHVPALEPVMTEFARVLRPGGHLVISDGHQESVALGSIPSVVGPGGRPARVSTYRHLVGDYLRAALPVGLQVRRCEEPRLPASPPRSAPSDGVGPWERWPWSLAALVPDAAHAVNAGRPVTIVWHFQLAG
ncbi:class I SAM-dependent methyltransferase [Pseudonocardia alaniniphila]|uniref:Class I SAM-dependent methyltransferase n=1 Tax=Pseudonocardia alaniniphila TaxID=75291 RepID=A0ABS9TD03_9PSEU|nr:class I SAM-dependent methyltransferase [Pseudonocardia alaniniphila]MCH6166419.1 class I SAM-dependent methyltransferase [Pseudonocardia alaniniphila]